MLNRFKQKVKKLNNTSCYVSVKKSELGKEVYVFSKEELELILGRKI